MSMSFYKWPLLVVHSRKPLNNWLSRPRAASTTLRMTTHRLLGATRLTTSGCSSQAHRQASLPPVSLLIRSISRKVYSNKRRSHMYLIWSRCPHCRKTLELDLKGGGPFGSKIGQPSWYPCPKCGKSISVGKKEWVDMTLIEKTWEIFLIV